MASSTNGVPEPSNPQQPMTVKTRILALSDTHAGVQRAFKGPLPHADLLIHAGDLTLIGKLSEHEEAVALLKSADADLKLVVPGNHDLTLDRAYCRRDDRHTFGLDDLYDARKLARIRALYEGADARAAGVRYVEEGVHTFALRNGAAVTVYASAWTPEFGGWAFAYGRGEDRFDASRAANPIPSHPGVDILVTHGPPRHILDGVAGGGPVGCEHLRRAVQRVRPRLHVFGHIHEARGAVVVDWTRTGMAGVGEGGGEGVGEEVEMQEEMGATKVDVCGGRRRLSFGKETLFVNASIMDLAYEPENAPWIIDLELPRARAGATEV